MNDILTDKQAAALGRAISCYLEALKDPDEQFLVREVINKLNLRKYLTDNVLKLL